ncbi:MAG: hypothetical protein JSU63_08510, partial [Phycisphaerales bacterium]
DPCEEECNESVENGHFVLFWPEPGDRANYTYRIAQPPDEPPPPPFWIEWSYRSNHPFGGIFYGCDAGFSLQYGWAHDGVEMYGDAVISWDGGTVVDGLAIDEFHTYRFETSDGITYEIAVDGLVFDVDAGWQPYDYHYLQLFPRGGCSGDSIPNKKSEWDYVRFGTIDYGEQIVS